MEIEDKIHIIEVGFGFDYLSISEVIEMCLNINSEETLQKIEEIKEQYKNEI